MPLADIVLKNAPLLSSTSAALLVLGAAYKLATWLEGERERGLHRGMLSKSFLKSYLLDVLLSYKLFKPTPGDAACWLVVWLSHAFFLLAILGLIGKLWLGFELPLGAMGWCLTVLVALLLFRRIAFRIPKLASEWTDYADLSFMLVFFSSGALLATVPRGVEARVIELLPGISITLARSPPAELLALHFVLACIFVAYLPFGFCGKIASSLVTSALHSAEKVRIERGEALEGAAVDRLTRRKLLELDTCIRCGKCVEHCLAYELTNDVQVSPIARKRALRGIARSQCSLSARLFGPKPLDVEMLKGVSTKLYTCTLCGKCSEACPLGIDSCELWMVLRSALHEVGGNPQGIEGLEGGLKSVGNPYGSEPELKASWPEYAGVEAPVRQKARVVYFVGCTTALRSPTRQIARAVAEILNYVGEGWTLLEEEPCCGAPALMLGSASLARSLAERNVKSIEGLGAEIVITGCPACYRALKFRYPALLKRELKFNVMHTTQYFSALLDQRRLEPGWIFDRIIYQDPCELGRLGGVFEEPRKVLKSVCRDLLEFSESRMGSRCCGGGGLLQAVNNELRLLMARQKIREASKVEASVLASACPSCKLALLEAASAEGWEGRVLDVAECLAQGLDLI